MVLAASEFVTVFEIAWDTDGILADACFRLLIGIGALIGGVTPIFILAWSLFWLYLHNFPHVFGHINSLVRAYRERQYQVVEGQVQMLYEQPATGHTKGDIISVNGKQFEVNHFYATPAYRNTLAYGGILNSGVYARIYYYNGEILRVDIRK